MRGSEYFDRERLQYLAVEGASSLEWHFREVSGRAWLIGLRIGQSRRIKLSPCKSFSGSFASGGKANFRIACSLHQHRVRWLFCLCWTIYNLVLHSVANDLVLWDDFVFNVSHLAARAPSWLVA